MDEYEYRRNQIDYKVIVDCYNDEEISVAWEIYMEENFSDSFEAEIIGENDFIPIGEIVEVCDNFDVWDLIGTVYFRKNDASPIEELNVKWKDKE
jgi:hypothetical protein